MAGPSGLLAANPAAEPFSPRTASAASTQFTELSPAETGIVTSNDYSDPRMWGDRYQEFALGGMGTGVAISDYDNDGWPDVFVVSKTETSRLFRNLGNWKFEDVTASAGLEVGDPGIWKQGASFADVDNDGWLDLYLCRWGEPNLLFMNQGDGTFREEAAARGLDLIDASGVGAFADYDRDGDLDVYVQTNMLSATASHDGQPDRLFRNDGEGRFTDVSEQAGIGGNNLAHSTTWWDYNHDGWPDIYVANDFGPPDYLYRNNGDGTFTNVIHETVPTMPYSSMGADQGDINNDGLIDFLGTDMATTTHEKDQRGMASARELSREDSDSTTQAPQKLRNTLFINTPSHRMLEAAIMAGVSATDWTWSVRFEDLDNDGWLDLHVTNGMNREYQNADLRDRIILAENPTVRLRTMKESPRLNEANLMYRNEGDLRFSEVGADWGLDQVGISFGTAFGDLDRDGDLDMVFSNYGAGATVLRNDSPTGNAIQVELRGDRANHFGVGAQVTLETERGQQIRDLTLTRGYLSTSEPILHFGLGEETEIKRLIIRWPNSGPDGQRGIDTYTNLAANQRYVFEEMSDAGDPAHAVPMGPAPATFQAMVDELGLSIGSREASFRENTRQPLVPRRFGRLGPAVAVGDLNGDGREDMILGGTTETPARIIAATGKGKFVSASLGQLSQHPVLNDGPVLIFDADGDGDADVLVTRTTDSLPTGDPAYQPLLLFNNGGGGLSQAPAGSLPEMPVSAGAVAAADFDRDGDLDVFVGARVNPGYYPETARSFLLRNEGGRFADASESVGGDLANVGLVTSALWSDVDGDGWVDLLVATEWGTVRAFRNDAGGSFSDRSQEWGFANAGTGWWSSLAAGDFNGDGRMDYVAGNVGLNTPYQASPEAPAVLLYGDFRGRGRGRGAKRIVEAYYEDGRLLPRRTSKAIGSVVPTVRRSFRRNNDFAAATVGEILGEEKLAAAERFEATEFRSGVFLSQADGSFVFSALPRLAQIAPLQGIVVMDENGDGLMDIVAVQNDFGPIPQVGRFDGGLGVVLTNDGSGRFDARSLDFNSASPPFAGDAKALVQIDLNGDQTPDLFATRNNDTTMGFESQGGEASASGNRIEVQLQGRAGNPHAIGASALLRTTEGVELRQEVASGSGYMSQSSPRLYFTVPRGQAAESLTVRWPDGGTTEHELPADQSVVVISR